MKVLAWPAYKQKGNPYNWLLYSAMHDLDVDVTDFEAKRIDRPLLAKYDVFHIHWPEYWLNRWGIKSCLKYQVLFFLFSLQKSRGCKIIWTVHNLSPHEKPEDHIERRFYDRLLPFIDGVIYLSEASRKLAEDRFPSLKEKPRTVTPLGHYQGVYPRDVTRSEARRWLGLGETEEVLLFLGVIRPYKGVEELITAVKAMHRPNIRVIIAGKPSSENLGKRLETLIGGDNRFVFHPRFIADDELQFYFSAADLFVVPYRNILNSSSAMLALSFGVPALFPHMGSIPELRDQVGDDWLYTYESSLTSADIEKALNSALATEGKTPPLEQFSWLRIAQGTLAFYQSLCGQQ